jgi:Subtilase family
MSTSRVTDMLRAKQRAFFVAALITSLAMESRSTEVIPPKPDRYSKDYPSVVSREPAYRFNQELTQFEQPASNRPKNRIDSSPDSTFVIAALKVRFDDRGPGQTAAEEHPDGSHFAETPTRRTVVVSPVHQDQHETATPGRTDPVAPGTEKPLGDQHHDGPDWIPWFLIILVIAALIVIWRILRRRRSEEQPRHPDKSYNPPIYPLRIAIKFNRRGGKPPQQLDDWQASLGGIMKQLTPLRLLPLFGSLKSDLFNELVDRARKNDPDYKPPDFSAWFQVETPAGVNADELVKRLRKLANVETAYVMVPSPPPVSADELKQHYQEAAPDGIDARHAWGFEGGDGAGIGFVDVEQGWNLDHKDLKDAKITLISGVNRMCHSHGTSVLGEVMMVDNNKGGVGIAPSAKARVISLWRTDAEIEKERPLSNDERTTDDGLVHYDTANAIRDAAAHMSFGDVLLIEVQERDPESKTYDWPAEILLANYEHIELAMKAGIVVVEAGGNGCHDLDAYKDGKHKKIFDRSVQDSGAIIVGAASSRHPHTKCPKSNYGKRIDCYAWGKNIDTTTTDEKGKSNTMYTTVFGDTSGASPIVAGAALILQGIAQAAVNRRERTRRFSPRELRDILKTNGTKLDGGSTETIGVMPNLRAIITDNERDLKPIPIPNPGPP